MEHHHNRTEVSGEIDVFLTITLSTWYLEKRVLGGSVKMTCFLSDEITLLLNKAELFNPSIYPPIVGSDHNAQ